ncbi:MAG: hypothetical protein E6713_05135 [Sporomusaceae bacterium]|nr:hypothetical protein [Sporomusaceae bacterium]
MDEEYPEEILLKIAEECQKFEHIINAMGYGYSLLNVSAQDFKQRCNDCVYWYHGTCKIFRKELSQWRPVH